MATVGREVLSRATFKRATVEVPEWGGQVCIRELSAAEVARVQQMAQSAVDVATRRVVDPVALARFQAKLVVMGWIDDDGRNVLAESDLDAVLEQPSQVVALVSREISRLSGMEAAAAATSEGEQGPVADAKNG
jgi:hypothetical protein